MTARLYLVAGKVTDSVTRGFLPAARRLGLRVTILTDRPADHEKAYEPGAEVDADAGIDVAEIIECPVTDYREIIARIGPRRPAAIFTNSDHLQAPTALAAAFFDLPGKDWRAATRTKNKELMRRALRPLDPVYAVPVPEAGGPGAGAPYPLVLKPREGVASEDVFLVRDPAELAARRAEIRERRADPLVAEEYLPGELRTLETLGDGRGGGGLRVLGSFRTTLSAPPRFIEERLEWAAPPPRAAADQVLEQLAALGVGFGACHTEFVAQRGRARLIEVNYRIIGDHCDFLLADLLGVPVFEWVLRVHLGEPLPDGELSGRGRHAIVDYVIADRAGTLVATPGPVTAEEGGVRVIYRPQRVAGDPIERTGTNRDYLGTIQAIGPDGRSVADAVARFRAAHSWQIG